MVESKSAYFYLAQGCEIDYGANILLSSDKLTQCIHQVLICAVLMETTCMLEQCFSQPGWSAQTRVPVHQAALTFWPTFCKVAWYKAIDKGELEGGAWPHPHTPNKIK